MALKMSIRAKDDVFESTRQRMASVEEESKKNCTRVIKQASGPDIGRKVKVRKNANSVTFPSRSKADRDSSPPTYSTSLSSTSTTLHPNASSHHNHVNSSSLNARTSSPSLNAFQGRPTSNAISPIPRSAASPSHPVSSFNSSNGSKDFSHFSSVETNPDLMRRQLRERIIHLLAIRPYKKPELLNRLHKEGLKEKDKKLIMPVLVAVGLMKDQAYHLARHIWNDVHDDWPFYTDQDKQILKRRKPQNLTPPVSDSSSGSGHSPPSSSLHSNGSPQLKSSPNNHQQQQLQQQLQQLQQQQQQSQQSQRGVKRPNAQSSQSSPTNVDPASAAAATAAKKQRISHYKKPDSSQPHSMSAQPDSRNAQPPLLPQPHAANKSSSSKVRPSPPNSVQQQQQHHRSTGVLHHHHHSNGGSAAPVNHGGVGGGTRVTSSTDGPDTPNSSSPDSLTDNLEMERSSSDPVGGGGGSGGSGVEYSHQYRRIVSAEQRSRYKEDFNSQYEEYRDLFKAIDKVSKRFEKLEEELRQQDEGTSAWQRIEEQIVREYKENLRDVKYLDARRRFQHLHDKLALIKRLILEWDTAQVQMYRS